MKEITATVSSGHTRTHPLHTLTYTRPVCMKIQIKRNAVNNIKVSGRAKKKVGSIMTKQASSSRTLSPPLAVTNEVRNVGVAK